MIQLLSRCRACLVIIVFFGLSACGGGNGSSGNGGGSGGGPSPTITSVSVSCSPSSIQAGQTSKCGSTVTGSGSFNIAVTWSVDNGVIDQSGNYTAPSMVATATVKAVSVQDATKSGTAAITVSQSGAVNWSGGPGPAIPVTNQCFAADFDGDGKADLACYTGSGGLWNIGLSTGSGWQSQFWSGGPGVVLPVTTQCFTGDFNGDGKADLACYTGGSGSWNVALSTGIGWKSEFWNGGPSPGLPVFEGCFAADFNGDGKTDLACDAGNGSWNVALSTGNGWQTSLWSGGPNLGSLALDFGQCFAHDFDGDGKTDLACYSNNGLNNWYVALSTGAGWQLAVWVSAGISHSLPIFETCLPGDFNGDGKADIACFDSGNAATVDLSTGAGWTTSFWSMTADPYFSGFANFPITHYCFAGDFNDDHKTDLACAPGTNGVWHLALSSGSSWQLSGWAEGPVPFSGVPYSGGSITDQCFAADFNGDGKTDLACYLGSGGVWSVALSSGNGW